MATIRKDIGVVTAYAYAVAGGYEGTEQEFEERLGQAGITLEQLENLTAVATSLAPGSEATASYENGVLTFGIPQGDKGDKGNKGDTGNGIASIAKTGTAGLVDTYTITFTDGTTTTFTVTNGADGDITNVAAAFDATKAYAVGDMVLYQGALYAFTAAHPAGAWVESDAQTVILTDVVTDLKDDFDDFSESIKPLKIEATEALAFYPLSIPNGAKVNVVSKNGTAYSEKWACLFYDSTKTNVLFQFDVNTSDTNITETINVDGIAYFRPNYKFSGNAFVTVLDGQSLEERVGKNTADISANEQQIADAFDEIEHIKAKHFNMYDDIGDLILGRVFQGVYQDTITTMHCTDYISIVPGHTYVLYGGYMDADYTNYYDKAKTYKGTMPLTVLMNTYPYGNSKNCALFTAPADCYFTRINFMNEDLDDGELQSGWYLRDVTERTLAQKNVLVVGDSISTDVYGGYKKWVTDLIENGTLSEGFTTNNSQHATGFVAIYSSDTNSTFIKRVTALEDLTGYDMIVTFGGINDWIQSINFDDFKDAVDTYFAYLVENATQARIVVLSPMHTALYGTTNNAGKTQKDYADYIKEVAQAYSFPLLNLTDESGFCPDKSNTFSDMWTLLPAGFQDHDGVHPTAEWELKYLAPQIADFLEGLIA